jgi:hypothetical protein
MGVIAITFLTSHYSKNCNGNLTNSIILFSKFQIEKLPITIPYCNESHYIMEKPYKTSQNYFSFGNASLQPKGHYTMGKTLQIP